MTTHDPGSATSLQYLATSLARAWHADTAWIDDWDPTNPARGQCGSSALVVQDLLGGTVIRGLVDEANSGKPIVHYWNSLELGEVDTTSEQFSEGARVVTGAEVERDDLLTSRWLIERYETLRDRVGAASALDRGNVSEPRRGRLRATPHVL